MQGCVNYCTQTRSQGEYQRFSRPELRWRSLPSRRFGHGM